MKKLVVIIVLALCSSISYGEQVLLHKANAFKEWKNVKRNATNNTFLVMYSQPKIENVENVVFISAGQQQPNPLEPETLGGYSNVLTGQLGGLYGYKFICNDQPNCRVNVKDNSLARKVSNLKEFPKSKTLMVLVFDSQFNHMRSDSVKRDILDAFWNLLTKRFQSGKVKKILLAGQSKGGCISFELAKRFRNTPTYEKIPLILQGYDPVCRQGRLLREGGKRVYLNPLVNKPHFKSVAVSIDKVFPANKRQNLAILDIHSGAPVLNVGAKAVHSFTFKPNNIDMGWWKQTWVPYAHTDMGGNMNHAKDTVIPGFNHIRKYTAAFAGYKPPGGGIVNSGKRLCPGQYPKQIGTLSGNPVCTAKLTRKINTNNCSNKKGMQWQGTHCLWGKNKYWHARPLKRRAVSSGSGGGAAKCPVQYPRKVSNYSGKPVCMAVAPRKVVRKRCNSTHGNYCIENKGSYYKARPLKGGSSSGGSSSSGPKPAKCPASYPKKVSTYAGKPVCKAVASRKIKRNKCNSPRGSYCLENKGSFYKARPLK